MKRRYAKPVTHKAIKKFDWYMEYVNTKDFKGYVSITKINMVTDVWFVPRNGGTKDCILAPGYSWLMLIPDNENYAITALYDEENQIKEWYFDMTKINSLEDEMPYFDDLYLDLVITKKGEIYILDEDELLEALDKNDITKDDYKMAHKTLDMLLEKYDNGNNIGGLANLTDTYLKIELEKLANSKN